MELTFVERWILSNQFSILAKVDPDHRVEYEKMCKVVENGYEGHYEQISQYIDRDVVSRETCNEVLNVMAMFYGLQRSYQDLGEPADLDTQWITPFAGFDGNNESAHYSYARFLVEDDNRFSNLEIDKDLNSHFPYLKKYRAMLAEWKQSEDRNRLSREDVLRITSAE